jgi:hypothetical protein
MKNSSGVSAKLVTMIAFLDAQCHLLLMVAKDGRQVTNGNNKELKYPRPTPPPGTATTLITFYGRGSDGKAYKVTQGNKVKRQDGMGNWWWAYPKTVTSTVIPGL